ncbi:MAG: hypothetical protein FWD17_09450 [Polyangiaceae bacterium]|nr:hypothetical protein [Polyangiaceae bacterium]
MGLISSPVHGTIARTQTLLVLALGAVACTGSTSANDTPVAQNDGGADVSVLPDGTTDDAPGRVGDDAEPDAPAASDDAPSDDAPSVDDAPADAPPDQSSTSCDIVDDSTLPHVHIQFQGVSANQPSPVCVFTVAQAQAGITIGYNIVVDQDVPDFTPAPPYPYPDHVGAGANFFQTGAANLAVKAVLSGAGQSYCVCDLGLPYPQCPVGDGEGGTAPLDSNADACAPVTIPAGAYPMTFTWDGRNWDGPSDTGNEEGNLFPAGDYQLVVSTAPGIVGDASGAQAIGKMTIHLLP